MKIKSVVKRLRHAALATLSLIFMARGAWATLAIVSPKDGETWMTGSAQQIKWTGGNPAWNTVNISLISGDGGYVVEGIAGSLPNNGIYDWIVNVPAGAYLAYIEGNRGQPDQDWTYGQPFLVVDSSSPAAIVMIGSPANGASVSKSVPLTAAVTGNIGSVAYTLDGSNLGAPLTLPPYSFSWDSTQVSNGTHTLVAGGWDKNTGQWSVNSSSITVTVNNAVKPSVTILSPAAGTLLSGSVTISVAVTGNVGAVAYTLDGADYLTNAINTPPSYSFVWDTTKIAAGTHTLTAGIWDAGTRAYLAGSAPVAVTIRQAPPVISNVKASSMWIGYATITWQTDRAADSQVIYGTTTAYGQATPLDSSMTTSHSVLFNGLSTNKTYHFRVQSKDAAGNLAVSDDSTFFVPAQLTVISPNNNATWTRGSTQQIKWAGGNPSWTTINIQLVSGDGKYVVKGIAGYPIGLPNNGSYNWTVDVPSGTYLVYIEGNRGLTDQNWIYGSTFTASAPDVAPPPIISNVKASSMWIGYATITWQTDRAADSQVIYGTTTAYGQATPLDSSMTTSHSVLFNGLLTDKTYHFRVQSKDAAGNLAVSEDSTFFVPAQLAIVAPASGETWAAGSTQQIKWTGGNPAWPMLVQVIDSAKWQVARTLASNAPNNGTFAWTADMPAGSYQIYVQGDRDQPDSNWVYSQPFSVSSVLPGRPGTPMGAVLGVSSIAWSWAAAADAAGYKVYAASNTSSVIATAAGPAYVHAGLTTNTAYGLIVQGLNATGLGALSLASTVYTLAAPPAATAVAAVHAASGTIRWALNGNPSGSLAEVQRSLDGSVFTSASDLDTTSFTDTALLGCTTYYYRVRYKNGGGVYTAFDATTSFLTLSPTPSSASGLAAESQLGNRILLTWTPSPTEGITQYSLYSDSGSGVINYSAPIAVLTSTETSYMTGILISSAAYSFAVRAKHRCGVEETSGVFANAASMGILADVRAAIKTPNSGKRIKGNRVTIVADLIAGTPEQTRQVTFQYRPSGASAWSDIFPADINHPNPDLSSPYFVHWNVNGVPAGSYDLRAVARNISGTPDAAPGVAVITVVPNASSDFDISESVGSDNKIEKKQVLNNIVTNTVIASGSGVNDPSVKVVMPARTLDSSTVTVTVVSNPVIATAAPAGFSLVGSSIRIDLSNLQTVLNGTAELTLSYPETAGDPTNFQIQSLDEDTGKWSAIGASTVDKKNRTVTAHTPHFSLFAIINGGGAQTDLSRVRVYPIPYKPNGGNPNEGRPFRASDPDSGIVFDRLPADVSLKIYDLSGRLVAQFATASDAGTIRWDAANADGRQVASGVYFAVIASPGHKNTVKKLAIIR